MLNLWINTATEQSEIALLHDGRVKAQTKWLAAHNLGAELLPTIYALLQDQGVSTADIGAILVNPGPGSFTGLRVGVTVANTLAWSLNIPVCACASLEDALLVRPRGLFSRPVSPHYGAPPSITLPTATH